MSEIFLKILNMSISASWLVLAVLLLRLVLKKAPKWVSVLLWGFVAIRLICPFSFESVLSLVPSAETVSPQVLTETPAISTGIPSVNSMINPIIQGSTVAIAPEKSINTLLLLVLIFSKVWVAGFVIMLLYTAVSYILLHRKVATAIPLQDNIYQSENIASPFVLGIIRPKIYIPFQMDAQDLEHVIAHETSHICRKDHWWKPLGFMLLALHWFNPLMWLGYILLCRDIELACDEKVIKEMDNESKADYTQALVACSINRRRIAACPLAFGEVGVKKRVKSVMNYRQPTFWITIAAVVICNIVVVCFLTNPVAHTLQNIDNYALTIPNEQTPVYVLKDVAYHYASTLERAKIQEFFDLRISRKEISQDRSQDRDKTHTLMINLLSSDTPALSSYLPGIQFHFNDDFTQVWADNGVKPTMTYRVKNPEKAREIYRQITTKINEPVATLEGNIQTYYSMPDGTFQCNGQSYQYRLEVTGRLSGTVVDTTFVYLSNLESISFEQAWKASGLSSNTADYFTFEEAILVEWITESTGAFPVQKLHFTDYLDMIHFVPGISQGDFIDQVGQYRYQGTPVNANFGGLNYDGPNGGGWKYETDNFAFYNDFSQEPEYMDTVYTNRLITRVPLDGLTMPYGITFDDTLKAVFLKIGIQTDPVEDFVADPGSNTAITLYQDERSSLIFRDLRWVDGPVDLLLPYQICYTERYEINGATTVYRTFTLSFENIDRCGLGQIEICVQEYNCLE